MRMFAALFVPIIWSCFIAATGLFFTSLGFCANYALVPQLVLDGQYNSNLFFEKDDDDPQEDYVATVSPGVLWRRQTEQSTTELFAQGSFVRYREEEDLDKTDQLYRGNINGQATEHLSLGLSGQYHVDHQIDRDIESTGLVLGTAERQRQEYRGTSELMMGERTHLSLSGGYTQDHFEETEFWNHWGADASLALSHRPKNWPNTILQSSLTGRRYVADRHQSFNAPIADGILTTTVDETNTTDTLSLALGSETRLSERLTLGFSGGARHTLTENDSRVNRQIHDGGGAADLGTADEVDNETSWGFVGSASLAYRGERNEVSLSVSHDLKPLSGSGETAERTSLTGSWWYQMTTEWRFNAAASAHLNRSDDQREADQDMDTLTFNFAPRVRYAFNRDLYLEGVYRYTELEDREAKTSSRRHLAGLTLSMQHDLFD